MNELGFEFKATKCNGWPKIRMSIDDDIYQEYKFSSSHECVSIPIDLLDGNHTLAIEIYGKSQSSTVVNDQQIIQDQLVTLENIFVDNVKLPDNFKYSGTYGQQPSCLTWGENNKQWLWNFSTPIIDWILKEKHRLTEEKYGDHYDLWSEKKKENYLRLLDKFENDINSLNI